MKPLDVFVAVETEFDSHIAALVVSIHTIHLTMKIKNCDFLSNTTFKGRIAKKVNKFLWQETFEDKQLAFNIAMVLHDYETSRSLVGLGGCVARSLVELLKKQDNE